MVYHYLFARHKRDDRAINAMVERAEKVAAFLQAFGGDNIRHYTFDGSNAGFKAVKDGTRFDNDLSIAPVVDEASGEITQVKYIDFDPEEDGFPARTSR